MRQTMKGRTSPRAATLVGVAALLSAIAGAPNPARASSIADYCASLEQEKAVAAVFAKRPGVPPVIYARGLGAPEMAVVSALRNVATVHGVEANPQRIKDIWSTVDQWGADANVRVIFSMGGPHVADFPSLTPITQPDDGSGFLDVYADNGDGVHLHLFLEETAAVFAIDAPGNEGATRMLSFYDDEGVLIFGVYASIAGKPFDQKAVDGFAATMTKVKEYPALCG